MAPITADKILTGHAYSRAVKGHIMLVHLALSDIILHSFPISDEKKKQINDMHAKCVTVFRVQILQIVNI